MDGKPPLETDNAFVVTIVTALSILGASAVVIFMLYDAIVHGAYVGAYLPFLLMMPFLLFARVLPKEHRGVLDDQVARLHLLLWFCVWLYLKTIIEAGFQYPTTPTERISVLRIAIVVSVVYFIGTGAGTWKVIRRWRHCRATMRGIYHLLAPNPLEDITHRCVREGRMPTAEEQYELLTHVAVMTNDDHRFASPEVSAAITARVRAYTELMNKRAQSMRASIECSRLASDLATSLELERRVEKYIADMEITMEEDKTP
jgi:hypothetical protein